jgi:hypothetical protein
MTAFAQDPTPPAQTEEQGGSNDQSPTYTCSLKSGATPTITADQAKAAALAANPGTTATKVELDDENGCLVYSVELSNGLDVKVDAGNGDILSTEQADADEVAGDLDNVQEEFGSQADDALESPHVEDAPGQ